MLIVKEETCRELVGRAEAFEAVESVFAAMASGKAYNFPVVREAIGHADALYGFKAGFDKAALTLGVKSGGYWPGNDKKGLTNHQSTVFLFNPDTGQPTAVISGNYLTAVRTAASSSVSIRHLARPDSKVLGMIGAGFQSAFQMRAALEQRPFEKVIGWNFHPELLGRLADAAKECGKPFQEVDLDRLGSEADVIITISSSFEPMLKKSQVSPGTHIACMGTDTEGKQEVEAELVLAATVFTDEVEQSITLGECQHAVAKLGMDKSAITPIGRVINGDHPGRRSAKEITLFDGTGVGLQDLAVARVAADLARDQGKATVVEL